jgi:hypothetical protein
MIKTKRYTPMKTRTVTWMVALAAAMFLSFGCNDEATISGKSTGTWIAKLDDLDPKVQSEAIQALRKAPQPVVESAKTRLLEIASKGTGVSSEAAILLATSVVEVRPEFASLYLRPTHMTHGIPDGGGEAIICLSMDHPDIAQREVRRRLTEATHPADIEELQLILSTLTTKQPSDSSEGLNDREMRGPQDNRGYSDE